MENDGFKKSFINTFADELNTRFEPTKVKAKINVNAQVIRSEMSRQITRWRETNFGNWLNKIDAMRNFADRRQVIMRNIIQSEFDLPAQRAVQLQIDDLDAGSIQLNSLRIEETDWRGTYFESVPITMTAIPKEGYVFDHWSGLINTTEESIIVDLTSPSISTFKAHFRVNDSTTSTEAVNILKQYIQIAPNPVVDDLFVNIALPKLEFINIELLDSSGKRIQSNNISKEVLKEQFKLNMSLLPKGPYWVRISVGTQQIVEQVIKL